MIDLPWPYTMTDEQASKGLNDLYGWLPIALAKRMIKDPDMIARFKTAVVAAYKAQPDEN